MMMIAMGLHFHGRGLDVNLCMYIQIKFDIDGGGAFPPWCLVRKLFISFVMKDRRAIFRY